MNEAKYFAICDIDLPVKIKINSLLGLANFPSVIDGSDRELFVTANICFNGQAVSMPVSTTYRCFPSSSAANWEEWLTIPVKYKDLPPKTTVVLTVWDAATGRLVDADGAEETVHKLQPRIMCGTTISLIQRNRLLLSGQHKFRLYRERSGDPNVPSTTPGEDWQPRGLDQLDAVVRKIDQRDLAPLRWLDDLAVQRIDRLAQMAMAEGEGSTLSSRTVGLPDPPRPRSVEEEESVFITVEFPPFSHPVYYQQPRCREPLTPLRPMDNPARLIVLHDPEHLKDDNPMELKYRKLTRSMRGLSARDLKPNKEERRKLDAFVDAPNRALTGEQKELLWTYRYSLLDNRRALNKFLRVVDWDDAGEAEQAVSLLPDWAPPEIADVLELLGPRFRHPAVRSYAVQQLERATDKELTSYLLQLVQALRYEASVPSPLSEYLLRRSLSQFQLASNLHWYLRVEVEESPAGSVFEQVFKAFAGKLEAGKGGRSEAWHEALEAQKVLIENLIQLSERAREGGGRTREKKERMRGLLRKEMGHLQRLNPPVRISLRPEVSVTGIIPDESTMFSSALAPLGLGFTWEPNDDFDSVGGPSAPGAGRVHKKPGAGGDSGASDDSCRPILGRPYKVIFKVGDDLRQDQLIIQMITLMDSLLKKNANLDLRLTPYRVLATSVDTGFVEFVPNSHTLTDVLEENDRNISKFFERHNPRPQDLGHALDNFVRSCAGYCVITYILGVGDRHLENVLLTTSGHLFHIDFGFIFGRDPKPFPPPLKLTREMVEAMGGADSVHHNQFRKLAWQAFKELRKHSNLIINMLGLMADANIPDMQTELNTKLLKLQEKFRLDLTDEQAELFLTNLINDSVKALFPVIIDKIHAWAQYWRA